MSGKNLTLVLLTCLIIFFSPIATGPAQAQPALTFQQSLILLDPAAQDHTLPALVELRSLIERRQGRIVHTFPGQAVIANLPAKLIVELVAQPLVDEVINQPVAAAALANYRPALQPALNVWNSLLQSPAGQAGQTVEAHANEPHQDAFVAPDVDPLRANGSDSGTPDYYQTSEYMAGSVAVGIVLVASNGTTDPSSETWTEDEKALVFSKIVAGLDWWAQREPRARLSFVYDDHFSNPLPTSVEPITRPHYDQQYWIAEAMAGLGYQGSSYFSRVRDYNNDLRTSYQTDWAFTIFVVDSSADTDNRFANGYFAYAYLGGPFAVLTYGNNGYGPYNMDAVVAHEVGHIFHALDQYPGAYQSCTYRSGYLGIENQNSQSGGCASDVPSIMRGQIFPYTTQAVDAYAAGQLGWRDSDGDDILDPLDTALPLTIDQLEQNAGTVAVQGRAGITPYPSPIHLSATINQLIGVQYRFNSGKWQPAIAEDGVFDSTTEGYHFSVESLPPGLYTLEVAALDSAGNVSEPAASATINVFDPIDGGLNTELWLPQALESLNRVTTVSGAAYDMSGGTISQIEYRINGAAWQPASAEDGRLDSAYELFSVPIADLEPGLYLIEARATDSLGQVETNFAGQQLEIAAPPKLFLPFVTKGK
jgi:hypothetical protein